MSDSIPLDGQRFAVWQTPAAANDTDARLNWLLAFEAAERERPERLRRERAEEEILRMHRPLSTQQAYALLGMLLGTFPPAAIFTRMFGYGLSHWPQRYELGLLLLCLAMNVVCCLMGKVMGRVVGQTVELNQGRPGWARLLSVMLAAVLWGIVTGAVGGFVCFGIGAFIAPFFAVPVGVVAFTVFTLLHRPLAHGGMIDACYFWPLACGVALSTAAMILSVR